jgi:hypothetical protein
MSNEHVTNRQAEGQRQWSKLAERACKDAELKQRLLSDPIPLLREAGIELPAEAKAHVAEENGKLRCTIEVPNTEALAESELAAVAGGKPATTSTTSNEPYLTFTLETTMVSGYSTS